MLRACQRHHRLPAAARHAWAAAAGPPAHQPRQARTEASLQAQLETETQGALPGLQGDKGKRRKRRLDEETLAQHPELDRGLVQAWILQGKVQVRGAAVTKAGAPVAVGEPIHLTGVQQRFVSRAGHKLEAALDHFGIDVAGKVALDAGLSTGGFTDCLLQRGAAHVLGVDTGYCQVAEKLRQDPRVTVLERTNLRYLAGQAIPPGVPRPLQLATLDLSFISLLTVLPAVLDLLGGPRAEVVALIKPQFEARREQVEEGGVVTDPAVHAEVIAKVTEFLQAQGLQSRGCLPSPVPGARKGNQEFLAYFTREGPFTVGPEGGSTA